MKKGPVLVNAKKKTVKEYRKGHITLNSKSNPEVKDWQVGEEYEITIKVRQTSVREVDEWDKEEYGFKAGDVTADFEVVKVMETGLPTPERGVVITKART